MVGFGEAMLDAVWSTDLLKGMETMASDLALADSW